MITVRDEVEVVTRKPEGAADVVLYTDLSTIRMRAEHDEAVPRVAGGHFQAIEIADSVVSIGFLV